MKTSTRTNYIDRRGIPHGDWRRIIGDRLAAWNYEREASELNKNKKED